MKQILITLSFILILSFSSFAVVKDKSQKVEDEFKEQYVTREEFDVWSKATQKTLDNMEVLILNKVASASEVHGYINPNWGGQIPIE